VCNSILEDDKPEPAAEGPRKIGEPFEVQELLEQYLTGVANRRKHDPGAIVLAIRKSDGQIIFNPPADTKIAEDDYLIAMGAAHALLVLDVVKRAGS
jgi:hypothetical protein